MSSILDCGCVLYADGRPRSWCPTCADGGPRRAAPIGLGDVRAALVRLSPAALEILAVADRLQDANLTMVERARASVEFHRILIANPDGVLRALQVLAHILSVAGR